MTPASYLHKCTGVELVGQDSAMPVPRGTPLPHQRSTPVRPGPQTLFSIPS